MGRVRLSCSILGMGAHRELAGMVAIPYAAVFVPCLSVLPTRNPSHYIGSDYPKGRGTVGWADVYLAELPVQCHENGFEKATGR